MALGASDVPAAHTSVGEQGLAPWAGPEEGALKSGTVGVEDSFLRQQGGTQATFGKGAGGALGQGACPGPLLVAGPTELVDSAHGLGAAATHGAVALH